MRLELLRTERVPDGVFGQLITVEHIPALRLHTIEDDWRDNRPRESCIPAGVYLLQRTIYRKHGYETFEVTGVKDRARILIHPANTEEDVEGCIGVGLRRGVLRVPRDEDTGTEHVEKQAVVASREAFRQFMELLADVDEATLEVLWLNGLGPTVQAGSDA